MQAVAQLAARRDELRRNDRQAGAVAVIGDGDDFVGHGRLCLPRSAAPAAGTPAAATKTYSPAFGSAGAGGCSAGAIAAAATCTRRAPVKRLDQ